MQQSNCSQLCGDVATVRFAIDPTRVDTASRGLEWAVPYSDLPGDKASRDPESGAPCSRLQADTASRDLEWAVPCSDLLVDRVSQDPESEALPLKLSADRVNRGPEWEVRTTLSTTDRTTQDGSTAHPRGWRAGLHKRLKSEMNRLKVVS
jgi:hypothetical protein